MNQLLTKHFTEGDRRTAIADTLCNSVGDAIDLTGCTVVFRLVKASDNSVLIDSAAATIDDATAGQVSYDWAIGEPPAVASGDSIEFYYWWIVTDGAGNVEHFPADGKKRRLVIHNSF